MHSSVCITRSEERGECEDCENEDKLKRVKEYLGAGTAHSLLCRRVGQACGRIITPDGRAQNADIKKAPAQAVMFFCLYPWTICSEYGGRGYRNYKYILGVSARET